MPSSFSDWQTDPTIAQVIVTNRFGNEYPNSYFSFRITDDNGVVVAQTRNNDPLIPRISIPKGPTTLVLNGPQIFNVNAVSFNEKIKTIAVTTNSIPEGNYEICISIYDQTGNNITSFGETCKSFFVIVPDPPMLLSPVGDEIITNLYPNFLWSPVTSIPPGMLIKYKLKICPVFEGQSPRTAIESNPTLLEKTDLSTTSYNYLPSDLPFNYFPNAVRFAWMVQAFDQNDLPATRNQGRSEIETFRLPAAGSATISLSNIYPANNDTIPWNPPHLIAQFSPYMDDIRSINFTLRVRKDGSSSEFTNTRTLNFSQGPQTSQGLSSQEKASLLITNLDETKNFPAWMRELESGAKYYWQVNGRFVKSDGTTITANSTESAFVIGLKRPNISSPVNDSSLKAGTNFNLVWQIPQPSQLNFSLNEVFNESGFHGFNSYSTAVRQFSLEISKQRSFDSIFISQTFQTPSGEPYRTGNRCDSLFSTISRQVTPINYTGSYYWRINYLNTNGEKYYTGLARTIRITPITSISCIEMNVQVPPNGGQWTRNRNPKFSVSIKPRINKSAITGGKLKIWRMASPSQNIIEVKRNATALDTTFTGNDDSKLYAHSTDMSGFTRYDLNFINSDTGSITFTADSGATYLWNFYLNFNKDSIRADGTICDSNFVVSNDGIFTVTSTIASDTGACPGECYSAAPTNRTPSTQTFAADSVIKIGKFDLKLTSVSGTGNSLTGGGSIDVPYLRAPILVEFNGIRVNTDNQVFEGEVFAKIVDGAPYLKSEGNDFEGQALSFAHDKLKFKRIHEFSEGSGRLVSGLTGTTPIGLPIGFDKEIDGHKVVIGLIGMKFSPTEAVLNAAMYVEIPSLGTDVGFGLGAKNICFHKDGIAGSGRGMLYLAQDFGYENEGSWSFLFKAPTPTDSGTYATWDCNGFRELVLAADVKFPRSWLKPSPDPDITKLVKARFKTRADKSGNGWQWMASADLEECEITSATGFRLRVQEMVFDFSTARNPAAITFPTNYSGTITNEWKGFFIKRASIIFPDKIKTFENVNPTISVNNLIIDRTGFTASIRAENIIQYPRGDFGKWGASIDTIKINLISSSLQSGEMKGRIKISIADSSLLYTGTLSRPSGGGSLKYQFTVIPSDTIETNIWKAKLSLLPTSRIELGDTSGQFMAQAVLNGSFTLAGNLGGVSQLGFKGIAFQNFKVMSISPYIERGDWSLASPQHSLAGFPVSISNLDLATGTRGGRPAAGIRFTIGVNLQPGSNAISGSTTLAVWGKLASGTGPQTFVFDGASLESITLNADLGAVRINGEVNLYNSNPTYGNGFRGALEAVFINQFSVSATAQFGSVNNYRYWYVDAKMLMNTGIPIFSGVGIYGFGGGAWYHMTKSGETNLSTTPPPPDNSMTPGRTNSGFTFTPNQSIIFGFRATIILGTHPSPDAFNGDVSLEAEFLSAGGISRISILGNGYLLCRLTNRPSAKVTAAVIMEYNFPTSTFHGVFSVNINASPFTGGGQMVLHFAPDVWYIKIGEPSSRINVSLANWLTVGGYFMVGMNLPVPPDLPSEIRSLFPGFTTTPRNPFIQSGDGFAFGASVDFNTGRKTFLIFYGQARLLAGFDFALLNFGHGTTCEGSSGTIGVNGWYAMGQIYAYVAASIGLYVDLWFVEGSFEILSLRVGAALAGAGPNPTWIKGAVGGRYRILGGAIKGNCNFEFKMGTECVLIVESPLSRIDLISDINPVTGSTNVDVFIEPEVALNFELDTPFELQEMQTGNQPPQVRNFRIKLRPLSLQRRPGNQNVVGRITNAADKYSSYYSPNDVLASSKLYRFTATAYGEEFISGSWQPARKNDGSIIEQTVASSFISGTAPDYIPQSNIAFSYPLNGQRYFLQNECRNGVVRLKTGQPNLFLPREGYRLEFIVRFIPLDLNLQPIDVPFTYNTTARGIYFNIPELLNNKAYYVQIISKEISLAITSAGLGGLPQFNLVISGQNTAVTNIRERLLFSNRSVNVFLTQRTISASRVRFGEKLLYVFYFKTSQYNTLEEKLTAYNYNSTEAPAPMGIFELKTAKYIGTENFDYYDFTPHRWSQTGNNYTVGPLVKTIASERTAAWHTNFTNPHIYDQIHWLRSKDLWSGNVQYERYLAGLSPTLTFVDIEHQASPPNIMDVTQMIYTESTSGGTGSGTGGGFNIPSLGGGINYFANQPGFLQTVSPSLKVTYKHGTIIPFDYLKVKNRATSILSNPLLLRGLSNAEKIRLNNQMATRQYQLMYRGNYPLKFIYNYWGCRGPDDPIPMYLKWFVY